MGRIEAGKGEAICQLVLFFFCCFYTASRLAELALSLTKLWFSLWGPAVVYSILAGMSSFALASAHISSQGAFCRRQFGVFLFCLSFSCV